MKVADIVDLLVQEDLIFLTGVPCSNLEHLLSYLNTQKSSLQHILATSEGEAVGIATGYHLSTNKVPIIYFQNSGFGNTVNPLTSLTDAEVYSIPALLFLSWRGEPGLKDEPQHKKMGRVMLGLLKVLEIPYQFASKDIQETTQTIQLLKAQAISEQRPVAFIFRSGQIEKEEKIKKIDSPASSLMNREKILEILLPMTGESPIITTTGKTSREVFELREKFQQSHQFDFLTVGSMGCAASIGCGVALQTKKRVFVIDGDGAVLMKMGTLGTIGHYKPKNLTHIIIDNGSYESTGGQPTVSDTLEWKKLLESTGYKNVTIIRTQKELEKLDLQSQKSLQAVVIFSQVGSRSDLGRPTSTPLENKQAFMQFLAH